MKHLSKLLSVLLVICLASALLLSSCDKKGDDTSDTSVDVGNISEYQDKDGNYVGATSGKKYDGETITFLTCGSETIYESEILPNFDNYENGVTQSYPQIINEDLEKRADILEEKLGLIVDEIPVYSSPRYGGQMLQYITNNTLSSTDEYQVVVPCLLDGATLAVEGALYNLLDLKGFQIEAPWWNQSFNESMTYADQLYYTIGDIGLENVTCTAALFFNYELWSKYGLTETYGGDPYELVRDGKWTVDTAFEAARVLKNDVNNDGIMNYLDEFGWAGQKDDMWYIFFGSGEKITGADSDGYPILTVYNERSAKVMEKLQDFVKGQGYYVSANDYFSVTKWPTELTRNAFIEGRTLFFNDSVGTVAMLGEMEDRFGVLPQPKYDTKQEGYHSLVNPWGSTCFAIPINVVGETLTMTIDALNVLGATSKNTVAKNYQEVVLSYMKTRDEESAEMINEYILPGRVCDLGIVNNWGGIGFFIQEMAEEPIGTFASKYEAKRDAAEAALQKTIDFYKNNQK